MINWKAAEDAGLVKLEWVVDDDYMIENIEGDTYNPTCHPDIDPQQLERERTELHRRINSEGVWGRVGYYRLHGTWHETHGVWGFVGQDAGDYEDDIKQETIEYLESAAHAVKREAAEILEILEIDV